MAKSTVLGKVIEELMNIMYCLEYFIEESELKIISNLNENLKPKAKSETTPVGSPTQEFKSDENGPEQMGPSSPIEVAEMFRNTSIFEYDPNKSLRLQLSKVKDEPDVRDSPGPFNQNSSPGAKRLSKSNSINNSPSTNFEEF